MRTNIVLDDELVDRALREFVANRKRRDIRELRGKGLIRPDYATITRRCEKDADPVPRRYFGMDKLHA